MLPTRLFFIRQPSSLYSYVTVIQIRPVNLDQLILPIPLIGGDLRGDLVGFGGQVAVVVIRVGELIVF